MYGKALEMGIFLHRGLVWTMEILSEHPVLWGIREIRRRLWNRATLSIGAPLRNLERGSSCTGDFESQKYLGSFFLGSRGCQESKPGGNLKIQ